MSDDKHTGTHLLPAYPVLVPSVRRYEETYGDHAQRSRMAARERLKLVVEGLGERIHQSTKNTRKIARSAARELGAQAGLLASRKLIQLARRIEQKAEAMRQP